MTMTGSWPSDALQLLKKETACVGVVMAESRSSAPREAGAWMVAGPGMFAGLIGGGMLEVDALIKARQMLADLPARPRRPKPARRARRWVNVAAVELHTAGEREYSDAKRLR